MIRLEVFIREDKQIQSTVDKMKMLNLGSFKGCF